jgi:PhzF family phenazine biosynthesis protein
LRIHAHRIATAAILKTQPRLDAFIRQAVDSTAGSLDPEFPIVSIVKGMAFVLTELPTVDEHLGRIEVGPLPIEGAQLDDGWESNVLAPYYYVVLPAIQEQPQLTRLRTRMVEAHIGEDPATGSAACTLCAYLSLGRGEPDGTYTFELEQGVEMGRRSVIRVTVTLNGTGQAVERVQLAGSAVITMRGTLVV